MLPRFFQDLTTPSSILFLIELGICYIFIFIVIYFYLLKKESFVTKFINILLNILFISIYLYLNKPTPSIFGTIFFLLFTIIFFYICSKIILFFGNLIFKFKKKTPLRRSNKKQKKSASSKKEQPSSFVTRRSSPFGTPQIMTSFGLKVRSKSEVFIAEKLYERKINFKYEIPLSAGGKTYYPDFTIYFGTKEIYWEHFGMLSDDTYAQKTDIKIKWYKKNFPDKLIWTQEGPNLVPYIHDIIERLAKSKRQPPHLPRLLKESHEIKGHASQNRRI